MTSLARFALYAALTLAVAAGVGLGAFPGVRSPDGRVALAVAGLVTLVAAVVGYVPVALARGAALERRAQAALLGVVVRLLTTMAGVAVVTSFDLVAARSAFLLWAALDYAILLTLETWVVAGAVRHPAGSASA